MRLLEVDFIVDAPIDEAWRHLAQVEKWPSWAAHIKRVRLDPAGELTSRSKGVFHLQGGINSTFEMVEFNPPKNWKWVGPFLWLKIIYDHRFEPVERESTRLLWTIDGEGFGVGVFGKLFASVYMRNLKKAIPKLVAEFKSRVGDVQG